VTGGGKTCKRKGGPVGSAPPAGVVGPSIEKEERSTRRRMEVIDANHKRGGVGNPEGEKKKKKKGKRQRRRGGRGGDSGVALSTALAGRIREGRRKKEGGRVGLELRRLDPSYAPPLSLSKTRKESAGKKKKARDHPKAGAGHCHQQPSPTSHPNKKKKQKKKKKSPKKKTKKKNPKKKQKKKKKPKKEEDRQRGALTPLFASPSLGGRGKVMGRRKKGGRKSALYLLLPPC